MFIPPYTTLVNKTIIYSDTVLPLKDSGKNLKICSINNVSEYSFEICLKKIFESNPDVIFNTIQYSKNDKTVYFYTDKTISTLAWEESKTTKHKPLSSSKEIVEEVYELIAQDKNRDDGCISLYDIAYLIKDFENGYNYVKEKYENYFEEMLGKKFYDPSFIIYDFDYKKNQLKIGFQFSMDIDKDYDHIVFEKRDGDLYVSKSETLYSQEIITILSKGLSELYDDLIKFSDFKNCSIYELKSLNSNFLVDLSHFGVKIYVNSPSNSFSKDFELSFPSYENEYNYKCNSSLVLSALHGKEDEIFKKIFVRIDDCPEWSKQALYQTRHEQLAEEKKIEEEQLYKEMKKLKRLELKRKLFPWINK